MNVMILSGAALIAVLAAVPSASASLVDVTYAGTIKTKNLNYGNVLFNTGDPYTVTFLLDTSIGNFGNGIWQGAPAAGSLSPILNITITINDNIISFDSSVAGNMHLVGGQAISLGESGSSVGNNYNGEVYFDIVDSDIPQFAGIPYVYKFSSSYIAYANNFEFGITDPTNTYESTYGNAYVNFSTLRVSEVPEISTWAMMLIGFAGLGVAGYRAPRKRAVLAA